MEWVLGLDGGGSKTFLALANREGEVLGPVVAEGINPFDNSQWKHNLAGLFARCPRPISEVAYATFGMPGYGEVPAISTELEQAALEVAGNAPHAVLNDVEVAFVGALAGEAGVLVLSGTGSMAWAGSGTQQIRVGGWGDGFGDEGSAYWIGHLALSSLSKALDGRIQDPTFSQEMMQSIGVKDITELLAWFYGLEHPRSHVARLAKTVDELANAGSPTAKRLLAQAAGELSLLAQTAFYLLADPAARHFSYAGSVFKSDTVCRHVRQNLEPLGLWQAPVLPPIGGALLYAAQKTGWQIDQQWIYKLQQSFQTFL